MPDATQPQHGEKRANLQGTRFATKGVFRFSVFYFLCALVLNMVVSPFVDQFPGGFLVATVLMTLVFLSALLAIGFATLSPRAPVTLEIRKGRGLLSQPLL